MAFLLSEYAANSILNLAASSLKLRETQFLRQVVGNLVLSGLAMDIAGTSRPSSGSEHLISHSLDRLYNLDKYHGEQVVFGSIVACYFQKGDWKKLVKVYREIGLPVSCKQLGVSYTQMSKAIVKAPQTRPDRFTILSQFNFSETHLIKVLEEIENEDF